MARMKFCTTNVSDGEVVHQRCILLTGTCTSISSDKDFISISTRGVNNIEAFPEQTWPVAEGMFKALVMLSPGSNTLYMTHLHNDNMESVFQLKITYIPLLQNPPLHLAIMVAKDSPLLIDCPPHKHGGFSSTHSDLDAAIAKFRMTAYMWQAMTAEDLRVKGLERRSFRLEEEWSADTVSRDFLNAKYNDSLEREGAMRATAKVHIIRSTRTTQEIRDANVAQQNAAARRKDDLFNYFLEALKEAGGPFTASARPVVAGLILDSHYSVAQNLILGHAALGCHNPDGISLGMFGSHLTYAWPRFIEEVTSCLVDIKDPGEKVGNDNGECTSMWEACTIGQGAHLHEVGHAFGSPHRPGIMERGYAQHWPRNFLSKTAYCSRTKENEVLVTEATANNARWDLSDALAFHVLPHFRLPTDEYMTSEVRQSVPQVTAEFEGDEDMSAFLHISCLAGIVRVTFNGKHERKPSLTDSSSLIRYSEEDLERRFDRSKPLGLSILGLNGREQTVTDVWKTLAVKSFIRIPGSNVRLFKRSVFSDDCERRMETAKYWEWAQLLKEKGADGNVHRATSIDMRVGCTWDGGVVRYADGHTSHWGPMRQDGHPHSFGGHASEKIKLPANVNIKRIDINCGGRDSHTMDGIRMHLTNGVKKGELNKQDGWSKIVQLEPGADEVIVGFYGRSEKDGFCGVGEFGIITASQNVGLEGLPDQVFELPEVRNTCGLDGEGSNGNESDHDSSTATGHSDNEDED